MANFNGVFLAIQTAFDDEGAIDVARQRQLIDIYLDRGMHGLVISSGTGQHSYLEEDEWKTLVRDGLAHIDRRCPVIVQPSALNMSEVIRRCKFAEDNGADGLMILPPYFEGPRSDDGIFAFYEAIDRVVGVDIIGYNTPGTTQIELSPGLYKRLLELPNFTHIKDSSGDLGKQQKLISVGGRVLNGSDTLAPYSLMAGAHGCIWGGANYMPREAVELYELVSAGDYKSALELWERMFPSIYYLWFNDYIPAVKAASRIMGFDGGQVRMPVRALGAEEEAKLRIALEPLMA